MGVFVRERPPLALSVCVQPPAGGPSYRWASDDPNVTNAPDNLTFSTTMPGGFAQMSCTLQRNRHLPYADEQEFSNITVLGLGGRTVAWQGRLEQLPDVQGFQAQVNPQASGWQSHLDDDDSAAMVFVDQDLSKWNLPASNARQIALVNGNYQYSPASLGSDPTLGVPALIQTFTDSWVSPWRQDSEAYYDSGPQGILIGQIYYSTVSSGALFSNIGYTAEVGVCDDASLTNVELTSNLASTTTVSGYTTPVNPRRMGVIKLENTTTGQGAQGGSYPQYWYNLAVYGYHGLTLRGSTDPKGVLASDVIAYTLSRWCPKITYTTGTNGTIQASTFVIPQLVFNQPTTSSTIIKQAAQYELLDWAVWELGRGPTAQPAFYLNQLGQRGRQWRARVGPAQLQDNGPNVSRIWNGVIVQFTMPDGTTSTVGPPGSGAAATDSRLLDSDPLNPANQAGLRRWAIVSMGTSTPAGAIQVGAVFLQAQKELDSSGQAALQGHVQDGSGVWWPSWMVRAGDSISFVDATDTSARRIVSTSYDHGSRTNSIQLDQPPDSLSALLQRLSIVIAPAGFS